MTALMWQILLGWAALVLVVCAVYAVIYYVRGPESGAQEAAADEQVDFFAPITETYPETAGELRFDISDPDVDDRFAAIVAAEKARGIYPNRWPYTNESRHSKENRDG